jgi:RNA polymerase sigma-70 factor (ECF subfamily)
MTKRERQSRKHRVAAFEGLVSEYEGALLRYATRIVRDADAAQDVVQNTFIKLFRNWQDELAPSPQMSSWLYRVAHNGAVDHLRKETRRRMLHQRHAEEQQDFVPPNRGAGFRITADAQRAAHALGKLNLRERQLVILKVYEEKSYKEIAEISGLTVSNVGYILHHAMKKLAAELRGHESGSGKEPGRSGARAAEGGKPGQAGGSG